MASFSNEGEGRNCGDAGRRALSGEENSAGPDGSVKAKSGIEDPKAISNALTPSDLENLNAVLGHEIAENTKRSYQSQWRIFVEWAREKRVSALPADPVHVAVYLAERMEVHGHKPATLRSAAAAVSFAHRAADHEDPCASQGVKDALKSATRKAGRGQKQAEALTEIALKRIRATALLPRPRKNGGFESQEAATRRGTTDIAIISLMRDAMLRVSEAAALRWDDLQTERDGTGRLLVRRSKTDSEGETAVLFVSQATMTDLDTMRRHASDGDSLFGLSANQIALRIKNAALAAGLGKGFSGHSPRVGMAQDLARAGTELPRLMTAGRWSSPRMPAHYIRNETAARGAVAQYYGVAADPESFVAGRESRDGLQPERLNETSVAGNISTIPPNSAEDGPDSGITAIIGDRSSSSITAGESRRGRGKREGRSALSRRFEVFLKRNRIFKKSSAYSLARRMLASQPGERAYDDRPFGAGVPLFDSLEGLTATIKARPAIAFLLLRCLPLALFVVAAAHVLSPFDWGETWVPTSYVVVVIAVVMTHGLLFPDRDGGLREFFWASVFFVLSTPMLQYVPLQMDPYGFYRVGDFASTHVPFMLALLLNLAVAWSAGLIFHVLRNGFRSRADVGNMTLKQACATTLLPLGLVYAAVAVVSNASMWIQMGLLIPSLAVAFTMLLALLDRTSDYRDKDRQFLLFATFTFLAACMVAGVVLIIFFSMLPVVSQVLPDHNLLRSWQIDPADGGLAGGEAERLLKQGYLWHSTLTFIYMFVVVGGNVLVAVFQMGSGKDRASTNNVSSDAEVAHDSDRVSARRAPSKDEERDRRGLPLDLAGVGAVNG